MDQREYEPNEPRFPAARVRRIELFLFGWAALILLRLVQLQIVQHGKYQLLADREHEHVVKVEPPRGSILDRNFKPLAMTLPVDSVYINPMQIRDAGVASEILAAILNLDQKELLARINDAAAAHRGFLWVKRRIEPDESRRLRGLAFDWISFGSENRRFYPYNELAAHVVGSMSTDDRALEGIELRMDPLLSPQVGMVRVSADVRGQSFAQQAAGAPPQAGSNVRLTIDSRIQYIAERELKRTVLEHHCRTGSVVVMDPRTGEILALASYPTFDPNKPLQKSPRTDGPNERFNNAVSAEFEPGSVFKVVTLTSALETTSLRPESVIPCYNGVFHFRDRVIHDEHPFAALPMSEVLAHSSNIGATQIGLRVGKDKLYDYLRRFGFGEKPGLPLPGEMGGVVRPPAHWGTTSVASVSMGYEISVTTVQLARACSVIASGGFLVKPHLLAGEPVDAPRRVIRPETTFTMRRMMEGVVLHGTGRNARLDGYTAAGKTGTAWILDPKTHRYSHNYNSSFMGFAPVANPSIVIVVTANGATGKSGFGAEVSAPVFKTVAEAALRYLNVPRDLPDPSPNPDTGKADDNGPAAIADLRSAPAPLDSPVAGDQRAFFGGPAANVLVAPKVPSFVGMTMRGVAREAAADGIEVLFEGHGIARAQAPQAGAMLSAGEKVKVEFTN